MAGSPSNSGSMEPTSSSNGRSFRQLYNNLRGKLSDSSVIKRPSFGDRKSSLTGKANLSGCGTEGAGSPSRPYTIDEMMRRDSMSATPPNHLGYYVPPRSSLDSHSSDGSVPPLRPRSIGERARSESTSSSDLGYPIPPRKSVESRSSDTGMQLVMSTMGKSGRSDSVSSCMSVDRGYFTNRHTSMDSLSSSFDSRTSGLPAVPDSRQGRRLSVPNGYEQCNPVNFKQQPTLQQSRRQQPPLQQQLHHQRHQDMLPEQQEQDIEQQHDHHHQQQQKQQKHTHQHKPGAISFVPAGQHHQQQHEQEQHHYQRPSSSIQYIPSRQRGATARVSM